MLLEHKAYFSPYIAEIGNEWIYTSDGVRRDKFIFTEFMLTPVSLGHTSSFCKPKKKKYCFCSS